MRSIKIDDKTYHIRPAKVGEFRKLQDQHKDDTSFGAALLSTCVVDKNGSQMFTLEQVDELDLPLYQTLTGIVTEVNGPKEGQEKN